MKGQKQLNNRTGEILKGFETADRLKPDPYFKTRLQARIDEKEKQQAGFSFRIKSFAPGLALGLIIVINAITGISFFLGPDQYDATREVQLETFGEVYGLTQTPETFISIK